MLIKIGSKNKIKADAVKEMILDYPHLKDAEIVALDVPSSVPDQPKSLDDTVQGAMNRAKGAFAEVQNFEPLRQEQEEQNVLARVCDYSFGIESGLMAVPNTKTGFMDVTVCAIFDGVEFHLGLSSAWEAPKQVAHYMLNDGLNMTQAACKAGLTRDPNLGSAEGLIGVMSKGRLTRKEYTKEAIRTALIHLEI